jgi:hypothetical protein
MKLCPILHMFHSICLKFSTVVVHRTLLSDLEFRETRRSEEHTYLSYGRKRYRFTSGRVYQKPLRQFTGRNQRALE